MSFKVNIMVDGALARKASLFGNLNGDLPREAVAELALAQLLATDPRIDEADSVLESAKKQAWRNLHVQWAVAGGGGAEPVTKDSDGTTREGYNAKLTRNSGEKDAR